jgi:Tfp pilus assembly protein PilO
VNKKVIAIAAAAAVVLVGVWYFAIFSSQSHSIKTANAQTAASNAQAATLRSQIAVLQQEKTQLPAATAKLSVLQLALPSTPALDKLIDDINASAVAAGVDWQTVSPAKPGTFTGAGTSTAITGGLQGVVVAMQVSGTTHQILDFVNKVNALSRLVDVTAVSLSNAPGGKTTGALTTQIFFIPSASPAAATPATVAP